VGERLPRRAAFDIASLQAAHPGKLPTQEAVVTVLKTGPWPWLIVAVVLLAVAMFVVDGAAGTIILACGFLALLGAGIRLISRNDPPPPERRVPAGHSGV
jgi:hypothetical protein